MAGILRENYGIIRDVTGAGCTSVNSEAMDYSLDLRRLNRLQLATAVGVFADAFVTNLR